MKDDDYMLSYMYGNFITLTNISRDDLNKIIKYHLDPLYVSVHSMDNAVRSLIFGSKKSRKGIDNLKILDYNGIETNIQIVLCPGINDGKELSHTLFILLNDFSNIRSIGIVPVGITKFNKDNNLNTCTGKDTSDVIRIIDEIKKTNRKSKEAERIYLSDEFYITAGMKFPAYEHYGDFYQIKNGIGKSTDFLKQVENYIRNNYITDAIYNKNILIVTSEYGKAVIKNALEMIKINLSSMGRSKKLPIKILVIKNEFFGGNVKAAGLLTGSDIISQLKRENIGIYEKIILPDSIFNDNNLTLDNYSKINIKSVDRKVKIISEEGISFIKELTS